MDDMENEIRKIVWQFEFEGSNGVIVNTNLSVRPFTQYFCMISSLNSYGIGYAGSKVHVETYELCKLHYIIIMSSICCCFLNVHSSIWGLIFVALYGVNIRSFVWDLIFAALYGG